MAEEKTDQRFSFAMTAELKSKMYKAAEELSSPGEPVSPSDVCRRALEAFVDGQEEQGNPPIEDFGILEVLDTTAKRLGLSVGSLVTKVLTDHLDQYIQEAEERQKKVEELKARSQKTG